MPRMGSEAASAAVAKAKNARKNKKARVLILILMSNQRAARILGTASLLAIIDAEESSACISIFSWLL